MSGFPQSYDAVLGMMEPEAWWKLADAVGSSSAADSSGNDYPGTVHGRVTFGQVGPITGTPGDTAALFDGSTGYVSTTDEPTGAALSAIAWYKATTLSGTSIMVDSGAGNNGNGVGLWLGGTGVLTGSIINNVADSAASNDGAWHMACVTFDGATTRLYRDGVQVDTTAGAGSVTTQYGVTLGRFGSAASDFFPGDIAEVAVLDKTLSALQVAALYAGAPKFPDSSGFPR